MTILIIGNGFDLNLRLPTSYGNYIESNEFELLLKNGSTLAKHLKQIYTNQRWVDIENELARYSKKSAINFETEYTDMVSQLILYLKTVNYDTINSNSLAYKEIKKLQKNRFRIINFNYTNSIKHILMENGFSEQEAKAHIIHIHGSLDENSIVFGVEDKAQISSQHIFLKKAFNPVFKSINIKNLLNNSTTLTFFGHSLGNTDHSYFKDFIGGISLSSNRNSKSIKLFYYGKDGYKNLMTELDSLSNKNLTWLIQTNKVDRIDTSQ